MSNPARTSNGAVAGILQSNWDQITPLNPFIASASAIVDRVAAGANNYNPGVTITAVELELIERWLAAHFYVQNDAMYMSKSTGGASGSFQRKTGDGSIETTEYGRMAIALDPSGYLSSIGKRQTARAFWAGTKGCR